MYLSTSWLQVLVPTEQRGHFITLSTKGSYHCSALCGNFVSPFCKKNKKRKKKKKNNDTSWFLPGKDACSPVSSPCSERCIVVKGTPDPTILGFIVEGEKWQVWECVWEWMCCRFTWAYFKQPVLIYEYILYNFYSLFGSVVVGVLHFFSFSGG